MIGPKKLSTIRRELKHALPTTAEDPIRWLEDRVSTSRGHGAALAGGGEILDSLRRFLESTPSKARRKRRVNAKQ